MMVLTISTYAMGKMGFSGLGTVLFLLATAVIKGTFIIRDYMELKGVSLLWRAIMYGWLWLVTLAITIAYIASI